MNISSIYKKVSFTVFLLILSSASSAAVLTFSDRIEAAANNSPEIDFYSFTVLTATDVTFSVEGAGAGFDSGNGPSTLDTFLLVAIDDGERTGDDILGTNDDGGLGVDSLFTIFLDVGDYLAAISSCCLDAGEFVSGTNSSVAYSSSLVGNIPDYLLKIEGGIVAKVPIEVAAPSLTISFAFVFMLLGYRKYFTAST